jgi:transposase InsO family protein
MVLDGYSRYVVQWELPARMTIDEVKLVIQIVLKSLPKGVPKLILISTNGPQHFPTESGSYLRDHEGVHSRIQVGRPQSNCKIEGFQKRLKSECIRISLWRSR